MKTISTSAIITGVRSKVDRSLGVSLTTPELTTEERTEFMNLQGVNLKVLFEPTDSTPAEIYKVEKEINQKTQGQRIRAVLFILWKQEGNKGDFEDYYKDKTEQYIGFLKEKIED